MGTFEGLAVVFITGALMGVGILFHFMKMGIRRVLGYDLFFDLFLSLLLAIVFHGTQGGMMLAIIAGIVISVALRVTRWFIGYEQIGLAWIKNPKLPFFAPPLPTLVWKRYPARIQFNKHR